MRLTFDHSPLKREAVMVNPLAVLAILCVAVGRVWPRASATDWQAVAIILLALSWIL
jgi:hypothetical protein